MLQEGPEEVWALVCVQEGSGHFLGQVMNSMGYEASDCRKRHGNEGCRGYPWCLCLGQARMAPRCHAMGKFSTTQLRI